MPAKRGTFIVLEGPDKSGKSTQARELVKHLRKRGVDVVHSREPGGTSFAEAVRQILLDPRHKVHPVAELMLYEASRAQHTHELLLPALRKGRTVLCERFTLASLVYQGHARGIPLPLIRRLNHIATSGLMPDLTVVFDIPGREFMLRDKKRKHDRLELESSKFRAKVREGYLRLAKTEPRTVLIQADRDPSLVQDELRSLVHKALARRKK